MGLEDELEFIGFPEKNDGQYKIIQLYWGNRPVMLFGRVNDNHPDMLSKFLQSKKIHVDYISSSIPLSVLQIPSPGGDGHLYHVVGMGNNHMSPKSKKFTKPEGRSSHYDIDANRAHSAIFKNRMIKEGWTLMKY